MSRARNSSRTCQWCPPSMRRAIADDLHRSCERRGHTAISLSVAGHRLTFAPRTFTPGVSKYNVICWTPAPSVTCALTVVHLCHPPVAGTDTVFHCPELGPLKPTWSDAPVGDA